MELIENHPTTAALAGVVLGALIGFVGSTAAARISATEAEKDRLDARRQEWLHRLAAAVAEISTIRGRLTVGNIHWTKISESVKRQALESLENQIEVRRELRTVGLLARAGGDSRVADECLEAERRLSDFANAVYGVLESVQGKEDPSIMEPRLEKADEGLRQAEAGLGDVLGSLNKPKK